MRIGILQAGYPAAEVGAKHGNFDKVFARFLAGNGFEFASYAVVDGVFPKGADECDGWIITGSKHGAYDALDFIAQLEDFVREAYRAAIPMVGICFGHQIMAQALGGRVEKAAQGWLLGRQEYVFEGGEKIYLNAWHQDQVVEKPKDAELIATSASCEYAGFSYGARGLSFQAHPEFENEFIQDYINIRGRGPQSELPADRVGHAQANIDKPVDGKILAQKIAHFFTEAV